MKVSQEEYERTAVLMVQFFVLVFVSVVVHELGHFIAFHTLGVDAHIEFGFPHSTTYIDGGNLDRLDVPFNRFYAGAMGGVLAGLVTYPIARAIHPFLTIVSIGEFCYGIFEGIQFYALGESINALGIAISVVVSFFYLNAEWVENVGLD